MNISAGFFLAISAANGRGGKRVNFRLTERAPSLKPGEVSMYVNMSLPQALFTKPSLRADITVPAGSVSAPTITAEVAHDIAEIVKQQTGLDLNITITTPQE